jgi:hypothetical protein
MSDAACPTHDRPPVYLAGLARPRLFLLQGGIVLPFEFVTLSQLPVMSRHTIIANHWYVSIERPSQWRPGLLRAPSPRQSKSFPTEIEAKKFAKAMVSEGLKVMAGTMNPHLPRRLIVATEIERWVEETE